MQDCGDSAKEIKRMTPEDFETVRMIGKGDVGSVYLAKKYDTNEYYAMKVLDRNDMIKRKKLKRTMTEREILATAHHPFIVTFYWTFQTDTKIYFIMEFCAGGSLYRLMQNQPYKRFSEKNTKFYSSEVLIALEYLHMLGFIYRDLKPENILIHESGHIKLTDFDLSKAAASHPKIMAKHLLNIKPEVVTNSFVGTEEYIAPDIIKGYGHTSAVDWWTFGILIFELICGKTPFKDESQDKTFNNILNNRVHFPEYIEISKHCKDIILHLLKVNPQKRLGSKNGASDIKAHPWFHETNWALIRNQEPPWIPKL